MNFTDFTDYLNASNYSSTTPPSIGHQVKIYPKWHTAMQIQIPLYSIIFLLAVLGNSLVILTLVQNKRMRTITNLYLLNLAVSDLFLGVFCMPFTLVGTLLRDFVFGEFMCKLLPYLQASSVAVSAWTLVFISVERYYAICYPLRSRRWQTLKHAYKMIAIIWCSSLLVMLPIAVLSKRIPTNYGHHKCREVWPSSHQNYEKAFNLFLDVMLLVLPLLMLGATYTLITRTLWKGMRNERDSNSNTNTLHNYESCNNSLEVYINAQGQTSSRCSNNSATCQGHKLRFQSSATHNHLSGATSATPWYQSRNNWSLESTNTLPSGSLRTGHHHTSTMSQQSPGLRRSNAEKSLVSKKRVIKMLFTVVLEFFICWTPLYTINTIALFQPALIYQNLGYTGISFLQLLAYSSSCCNPITYCFMSCGFRKAFLNLFRCCQNGRKKKKKKIKEQTLEPGADDDNNAVVQRTHSLGFHQHHHHSQRATTGSQRLGANGNGSVRFTTNNNCVNNAGGGCSSIVFSRFDPNRGLDCDNTPNRQNEMGTDNNDKIQ